MYIKSVHENYILLRDNINYHFLLISIIHFIITLFTDNIIFTLDNELTSRYLLIKSVILVFLLLFWQLVAFICKKVKSKDETIILFLKLFIIYFGIMFVFLLLIWPGVWIWDDLVILILSSKLYLCPTQHWITSLFYIISLSSFPFPSGVILMQIIFISLIIGCISYLIFRTFSTSLKYFFFIPMLFPTVIFYNLLAMRIVLYSYFEILLLSLILFKWYNKEQINTSDMLIWGVLTAILATWRSEGIVYIVCIPIVILISFRKQINIKKASFFAIATLLIFTSINFINNFIRNYEQLPQDYKLTAIASPLAAILKTDFNSNNPEADLIIIDRVMSVDDLRTMEGSTAFWHGHPFVYTEEEFREFVIVYANLAIRNLPTLLENQFFWFRQTSGFIFFDIAPNRSTLNLFERRDRYVYEWFHDELYLTSPINYSLRAFVVKFLEGRNAEGEYNILRGIFYNLVFPIAITLAFMIYSIFKRKWPIAIVAFAMLSKTGVVFLTAPASFFMYYLPIYICGYGLGVIVLLMARNEKTDLEDDEVSMV